MSVRLNELISIKTFLSFTYIALACDKDEEGILEDMYLDQEASSSAETVVVSHFERITFERIESLISGLEIKDAYFIFYVCHSWWRSTEDSPGVEWTLHTFYHDIGK